MQLILKLKFKYVQDSKSIALDWYELPWGKSHFPTPGYETHGTGVVKCNADFSEYFKKPD